MLGIITENNRIVDFYVVEFFPSAKIGMMEDLEDMKREEEELKRKAERKKMREKELKKKRR